MRWDLGIDLGTENVRMAELKQGPMLEAAAALAFREGRDTPVCGGDAAARLYGRTCEGMSVVRPLRDGVLENSFTADRIFHWLYRQMDTVNRKRRFNVLITCAPFARPVQMDALLTAAIDAGAQTAALVRTWLHIRSGLNGQVVSFESGEALLEQTRAQNGFDHR